MANKISGITIELGGDASGLDKAISGVNSQLKSTQAQLQDVNRLLKLDPTNTELLAQKQKLLADQISNASEKLSTLKQAQATMDQNGVDKNSDQYMALQREIISTEREIKSLKAASEETANAMNRVAQVAGKVAEGAQKVADKTKKLSAAAGGALAALGGLALKSAKDADELNTLAKQTGFSTAELQKFRYASDLVDVSMDDITGAATKLKKAIYGDSQELAALGVETKNADGSFRDVSAVFYDTLAALGNVGNETERDALAMAIFGRSADSLAGIIDDGGASLRALGQEAEDLGLIMSQDTLDGLNKVNDSLDQLKAKAQARLAETGAKALEVLTPVLEKVLDLLDRLLTYISGLNEDQMQTIMTILGIVAAISPLAGLISKVSGLAANLPTIISTVKTAVTSLGSVLKWLVTNPIGAVIAAIVIIATKGDEIKEYLAKFDEWLQGVFAKDWTEIFGPVLGGILNGFFDTFKGIWDGIKLALDGIIDIIRGVFTGDWERAWNGVKEVFAGIFGGIASLLKAPLNGILRLVNNAIEGINKLIDGINKIPGVNIGHIGTIPLLANGGIVTKGQAIVGEAGPELLTVSGGKTVVQPLTGAASAAPIYLTVQSVLDGRVIAESTTKYQGRAARAHG